jgi:hypothetical protein
MKSKVLVVITVLGIFFIAACATIMNEDMVSVPVYTTPSSAKLVINGMEYTSPATIQAPRGKGDFKLHIEKEGYKPVDILLRQSCDAWLWGDIIFGGLIGLAVDFITGDAYDFDPEVVSQELQKEASISKLDNVGLNIVLIDIAAVPTKVAECIKVNSHK